MGKPAVTRIALVVATGVFSGCFRYVPAELGALPAGDDVRLELTRVGFAQLPEMPNHPGPDLNGRLVRGDAARLFVSVPVNVRMGGIVTQTVQQEVSIPAGDIVRFERRELNRMRTGLAIGGGLATLGVIFLSFHDSNENAELPDRQREEEAGVGLIRRAIPLLTISNR